MTVGAVAEASHKTPLFSFSSREKIGVLKSDYWIVAA